MDSTEIIVEQALALTPKGTVRSSKGMGKKPRAFSTYLDKSLFLVVAMMLLFTVALLSVNLVFQHRNYDAGIAAALKSNSIDHAVVITYTRAWDFAIAKISSIFLAFCLILIGALYVLRAASASYSLSVTDQFRKSSLETGSPGLVMMTLGVALMAIVILSSSTVEYKSPDVSPAMREQRTIPPDVAVTPNEEGPQPRISPEQRSK
jgi:hypothetical protein